MYLLESLLLLILAYFQIGHTLSATHSQADPVSRPFYTKSLKGYFINLALWPLGARRYKVVWFLLVISLTYLLYALLNILLKQGIENLTYRLLILLIFAFTPIAYFVVSIFFATIRIVFASCRFKIFFHKAFVQKLKKREQVNKFVLDKNPLIQNEILIPSIRDILPGQPKRKKHMVWVAHMYFFVDSIIWLSAFLQTLSGNSKDVASNEINEETAVQYASQITDLLRE